MASDTHPTVLQAQAFISVAELGSYSAAARHLETDVAGTHRLVKRFQDALGIGQLVGAKGGTASLTPTGRDVLPTARAFVANAERLQNATGAIRFAAYPSIVGQALERCGRYFDTAGAVELVDVTDRRRDNAGSGLVSDLHAGMVDVVIAPARQTAPGITESYLYTWTLRVVLPPGESDGQPVSPDVIAGRRLACAPPGRTSRRMIEEAFAAAGVGLAVEIATTDQALLRRLPSLQPAFVALLPDDALGRPDPEIGPALTVHGTPVQGQYSVYTRTPITDADQTARELAVSTFAADLMAALGDEGPPTNPRRP